MASVRDWIGLGLVLLLLGWELVTCDTADLSYTVYEDVSAIVATRDGHRLVLEDATAGTVSVLDLRTSRGARVTLPRPSSNGPHSSFWSGSTPAFVVSPDGGRSYAGRSGEPAVSMIDNNRPAVLRTVPVRDLGALALSPDGRTLYVVGTKAVVLLDARTLGPVGAIALGPDASESPGAAVSPDGRTLYVNHSYGVLDIVDLTTGRLARTVTLSVGGAIMVLSPDGRRLYLTDYQGIGVVDALTGQVLAHLDVKPSRALAISPDGRDLCVLSSTGRKGHTTVVVVSTDTLQVTRTVHARDSASPLTVSADGGLVFTTGGSEVRGFRI